MKALIWRLVSLNRVIFRLTGWAVCAYGWRGQGFWIPGTRSYHWKQEAPDAD